MSVDPGWTFVGASPEGRPFPISGLDVWTHDWCGTTRSIRVEDPAYHGEFTFRVYELRDGSAVVRFAAGEFSNGVWGFYVERG